MNKKNSTQQDTGAVVYRNGQNGPPDKTRYSTIDLFNDLRAKHGAQGGNFYDWLRREREEKLHRTGG
jgi:hypothetical protein